MEVYIYIVLISLILLFTFITSLSGLGAAFIIIPLLLTFGYSVEVAAILGLSFNFINTLSASTRHFRQKSINFRISVPIILVSLFGAPVGALLVNIIPSQQLKLIFAIVLVLIGLNIMIKMQSSKSSETMEKKEIKYQVLLSVIIGFFVGFVSGLLGIGGGAIVLPLLLYFGVSPKKAAGTTSFIVVFSSIIGIISKLIINNYELDYILLFGGIIASIIGALLGSYAMHYKLKQSQIKLTISFLLVIVGIKMIFDYY